MINKIKPVSFAAVIMVMTVILILIVPGTKAAPKEGHADKTLPTISDKDRETLDLLRKAHETKIYPLKQDLLDNRLIYKAISQNKQANTDEIRKIVADMRRLRDQIRDENLAFHDELKKTGIKWPYYGHDWGQGHGHLKHGNFAKKRMCPFNQNEQTDNGKPVHHRNWLDGPEVE